MRREIQIPGRIRDGDLQLLRKKGDCKKNGILREAPSTLIMHGTIFRKRWEIHHLDLCEKLL